MKKIAATIEARQTKNLLFFTELYIIPQHIGVRLQLMYVRSLFHPPETKTKGKIMRSCAAGITVAHSGSFPKIDRGEEKARLPMREYKR